MSNIYIDLDSIIDTRLGLLNSIDSTLAARIYSNGYQNRHNDNYPMMHFLEFKERYRSRTPLVLKTPFPTMMLSLVQMQAMELSQENLLKGGDGVVTIYLNFFPYDLDKYEKTIIINSMLIKMPKRVKIIDVFDESVSLEFVEDNIHTIIKYDGLEWLNKQISITKHSNINIHHVDLIVPDIISYSNKLKVERDDILQHTAFTLLPIVNVMFVSVGLFSAIIK